jgi:hypothetical protein
MLLKLGYDLDKGDKDRVANVNKTIALESALALPKVLDSKGQLDSYMLKDQLDYVASEYPVFDKKTGQPKPISSANIDYTDDTISDMQRAVFLHFLQIANMESALKDVKLRTNFDTTQSGSLYDAQNKINQLMELKRSRMDSTNNSQTKFWRIPSEVIERMVPTIKRSDGSDTGILDESKAASILAGFYQQPFQLAMWRDLFSVKNNPIIDTYLSDMDFKQRDDAKKDTYLETDEKVITEFKNTIIPLIFQNSFLGYDISELDKDNTGKVGSYRGSEVRLNSVISLPNWGAVARMESRETSSGVVIQEPVLYYDYNTLYHQFIHKTFATPAYDEVGLAKLDANQFNSFGEYVKFVFEREYLRATLIEGKGRELVKNLRKNTEYKELHAQVTKTLKQDLEGGETLAQFQSRKNRVAFEQFIRNKALKNVYNMHAMFNGTTSFAYEIASIKSDPSNQGLLEAFPILNQIIPDSESSRSSNKERVNFAFVETPKDASTINSYYEQLQDLANEVALQRALPGLDRDRIGEIADVFRRLPIAAFMQSGMNTSGKFSFGRVIDQNLIYAMTKGPADEFIQKITEEKSRNVKETLDSYWKAFIAANKRYDARGKNLTVNTDKEGKPTSNIDNELWVNEKGRDMDFRYLNQDGTILDRKAVQVGDELILSFAINGSNTETKTIVQDVSWNGKRIVVSVLKVAKKQGETPVRYNLMYDENANLIQYQKIEGDQYKAINDANSLTAKVILGDYLVNQLKYGKVEETKVGGTVEYLMAFSNGNLVNKTSTVLELEELGYPISDIGSYKDGLEMYRIKIEYTNKNNKKETQHFIVDTSGQILYSILSNGVASSPNTGSKSKIYVELPVNRKKGQYIVQSLEDAQKGINTGSIVPGTLVEVMSPTIIPNMRKSTLYVYDEGSLTLKPLEDKYDPVEKKEGLIRLDETNFFAVYNGVVTPGASVYSDGQSTPASTKGKVDIRDRYMEHSGFTNKATLITRNKYSGGALVEFFTDNIDPETGKASMHDWVKQIIDNCLDGIQAQIDAGLTPIFNQAGYGQYMIGADDSTGKMIKDADGKVIGQPIARETFLYLSQQLMQRFGFMNPNYVTQPEGQQEFVKAIDQPVSDQEYMDLMNKCFSINVSR